MDEGSDITKALLQYSCFITSLLLYIRQYPSSYDEITLPTVVDGQKAHKQIQVGVCLRTGLVITHTHTLNTVHYSFLCPTISSQSTKNFVATGFEILFT